MPARRSILCLATVLLVLAAASLAASPPARADGPSCALTNDASTPSAPSPGNPCWTDVTPYPFGSDGNPIELGPDGNIPVGTSADLCDGSTQYGQGWLGDYGLTSVNGNPLCYLQVNSFAFRAWNRGLAATGQPPGKYNRETVGFGVWLFNGSNWFPDPTFPGSNVCPGSIVLWAGKLDYWLIGPTQPFGPAQTTLCRFDGVNLQWEPLSLPAATLAKLPSDQFGKPVGGITSGACYAWNNCWFFGDDGTEVHWDGQSLTDASSGLGTSPWLQADFASAVAGTDSSGSPFGLAVTKSTRSPATGPSLALPVAPDGSPPTQVFGSQGGPWEPLPLPPMPTPVPQTNPPYRFTTDLNLVSANSQGDVWVAGDPDTILTNSFLGPAPAPLERLTENGAEASCGVYDPDSPGYDANTLTSLRSGHLGYTWKALSVFPDGGALAGAGYGDPAVTWSDPLFGGPLPDNEPALVHAVCGHPPTVTGEHPTEFLRPDPLVADQTNAPDIPADLGGYTSAVAANATNDAWAATSDGSWTGVSSSSGATVGGLLRPHLYRWTDGQPPDAPAGDDNETRPSLFTLGPPVYQVGSPTVVVTPVVVTTTHTKGKPTKKKLPPAIYAIHTKLQRSPDGTYTLYLTFKVRRPVTIGLEGLQGKKVVASTGLKRFTHHTGQLALKLDRQHWPTRLALETPKSGKKVVDVTPR
ncbi:MAG TPA: hypothetical protein VGI50_09650 [Solirubrobacteraceae bacterium]